MKVRQVEKRADPLLRMLVFMEEAPMKRQIAWALLRLGLVGVIYLPIAYTFLILIETSRPRFLEMNWDAYIWLTLFLLVIGYCFLRMSRTKEFGKLFLVSVLGVSVLMMYEGQSYTFDVRNISANTLYVVFLFLISGVYFVVPTTWIKPLLFLLPVSALSWFLRMSLYQPICFSYEVYLSKSTMSPEQYDKVVGLVLQSFPTTFIGGSMAFGLLLPYWFALYGSNPNSTYKSLTKR
ncbi:hypothetical protein [Vibrio sp. McD22-P3]|uniref:hypothetical protein n=1 Tax=Vibrio sp. McD22-P3 TaxID=2724880 RepID=UPI001F452801|nr:hypothetical protein [Vibrio sp. McD22-P3]MCF4176901.1 hypothetical protein [Vibrio sp. McD22-P3]